MKESEELWLLQRIVIADFMGLDSRMYKKEAENILPPHRVNDSASLHTLINEQKQSLLGDTTEHAAGKWPYPIIAAVHMMLCESVDAKYRRLHRLIDSFEVLIKYIASIMISDILEKERLTSDMRELFVRTLKVPLLSNWIDYTRVATAEMISWKDSPFIPEVVDYYNYYIKNKADTLLGLRNFIAHSSTPDELASEHHVMSRLPDLLRLLSGAKFLTRYHLCFQKGNTLYRAMGLYPEKSGEPARFETGEVLLHHPQKAEVLKISPLLRCHSEKNSVDEEVRLVFYNDQKHRETIHYLSYENAWHFFDRETYSRFVEYFPLADWRSREIERQANNFIEDKTQNFVGRQNTISHILRWIDTHKAGYLLIEGLPGTGKSSIAAVLNRKQLIESLFEFSTPGKTTEHNTPVIEHPGKILNQMRVLPYFIQRNDASTLPHKFLTVMQNMLAHIQHKKFRAKGDNEELQDKFTENMKAAARILSQSNEKLIFLIDGLDETLSVNGEENSGANILHIIKKTGLPENTYFIFTSRPRREIDEFYHSLDRQKRRKLSIGGLSEGEIREYLYESVSKYDLDESYVKKVIEKSEGNPLYLTLLIAQLREGSKELNRPDTIPETIHEVYESTIHHIFAQDSKTLQVLLLLSIARENLSIETIGKILGINDTICTENLVNLCAEVITREKDEKGRAVFRVFHDTFGEYMVFHPNYQGDLEGIKKRILTWNVDLQKNSLDDSIYSTAEKIVNGDEILPIDINAISNIVFASEELLTARYIIIHSLVARRFEEVSFLFTEFLKNLSPSLATMTVQCLGVFGRTSPEAFMLFLESVSDRELARIEHEGLDQNRTLALQLIVDVLTEVSTNEKLHDRIRQIIVSLCRHKSESVLMLGIGGVYRITRRTPELGMQILSTLSENSLRFRVPIPSRLKPFIGSALAVYFDPEDKKEVNKFLYDQVKKILQRAWGTKIALWFLPPIISSFLGKLPEDYNPENLYEISQSRKIVRKRPPFIKSLLRVVDLIDPAEGSDSELEELTLEHLSPEQIKPEHGFLFLPLGSAFTSRAIINGEPSIESAYRYWDMWKNHDFVFNQDILTGLHLIDMGKRLTGREQLGEHWCERAEEIIRHYFYRKGARFHLVHEYRSLPGLNFLVENRSDPEQPILRELIDYVCTTESDRIDQDPVKKDLSDVILRWCEVFAIEYGTMSTIYREATYFGIRQYLRHFDKLDKASTDYIVKILARMRFYHRFEIDSFVDSLPRMISQDFRRRLGKQFPSEDMGTLLSMRGTYKYVSLLSEPAGKKDGLRGEWQDFCRLVLTEKKMSALLRGLGRNFFDIFKD